MFIIKAWITRRNIYVEQSINNEKGYTLVEMLLSLSIFSIIIVFLTNMVPLLRYHAYSNEIADQMQWEMFMNQAKRDIRESDEILLTASYSRILFWKDGSNTLYERYGNRIRRRVDGMGHQLILFNIRSFDYEQIPHGIKFIVTHENGKTYEGEIYLPREIPITNNK